MRKHPRQYSVIFTFYSLARSNLVIKRGKQASLRERECDTRGFPYPLNVLPFPLLFRTTICGCKKMQANKTLYKSNVLSIIECKSRIETVFYCSYPNRGTNQYTRWLVSLSRDRKLAIIKKPTLRIKRSKKELLNYEWSPFSLRDSRASETRTRVNITSREKGETRR